MTHPLVSVVLPTYNRVSLLPRAVGSVLRQSFADLELLLVDDGSTEDVRAHAMSYHDLRLRYIRREIRGGPAAARNTGIHAARGRYLAFQDSDDEWLLDRLDRQMRELAKAGPDYGMCVCGLLRIGGSTVRSYPIRPNEWQGDLSHADVIGEATAYTQTWLVLRSAVIEAGGFDEALRIWDDWELLVRLSMHLRIRTLSDPLVISERAPDSLSMDGTRFTHDLGVILRAHAAHLAAYPYQHALLEHTYARLLSVDGRLAEARAALRHALRLRPWRVKSWVLFMATFGGHWMVRRLLRAPRPAPKPSA